ncbi:MAG: hypothetical protein ACLQUT_12775 [Thermoleophilia bacterium]
MLARLGELDEAGLRRLAQEVVDPAANEPFGAYLFTSEQAGARLARALEQRVFLESFGNTAALLAAEYGDYEAHSVFLCLIDQHRKLPVGMMRILLPSTAGFKSLNDIEPVWGEPAATLIARTGLAFDPLATWDIATLAVAADYRGKATAGLVSMGLYQTLSLAAKRCSIDWFVAILDLPVFRLLRWQLHLIFAGYSGAAPRPYLGSVASMPAWCEVAEADKRLAATDPDLHAILVAGTGLEAALRPVAVGSLDRLAARQRQAVDRLRVLTQKRVVAAARRAG